MKVMIPIPGGLQVEGTGQHGRWFASDKFRYDGKRYEFLGRDATGALHAQCTTDGGRLCVFESSNEWEAL